MSAEVQELVQSLTHTTGQLARLGSGDVRELEQALVERARAVDAIGRWIATEQAAGRTVSREVACQLTQDLEKGTQVLLGLALAREVMRSDRMALDRELQVLRGVQGLCAAGPRSISYEG